MISSTRSSRSAVPRDVEPEVAELDDVFLYSVDDLGEIVKEGLDSRQGAVAQAEAIIDTNERSHHDCLYVIFSSERKLHESLGAVQILLPYLDMAFCRVTPLTDPHPQPGQLLLADQMNSSENPGLSKREVEIMKWVKMGKTNLEIASILDISIFTVKNHLRHIFKVLDVSNRMQAAAKVTQSAKQDN